MGQNAVDRFNQDKADVKRDANRKGAPIIVRIVGMRQLEFSARPMMTLNF